ncbi:MAG: CDP-glucose 4,6-dehydratase, partial [Candidatus Latescibacteria bacterium]|nr:CDP-glucose 4,6-dehydratase [Candidatus Latescibacterota bacterium]
AKLADAFNFGPMPGNARSVQEIVDAAAELWGNGAQYRSDCRAYPPETRLLSIDSTKAMTMLDWCPRLDLTTTLKMTVDWYRAHLRGADMRCVTREQVRAYMET